MAIYVFPLELRDSQKDWPFIAFTVTGSEPNQIFFPIPQGLTFSDSMIYSSMDLGILGDIGAKAAAEALGPKNEKRGMVRKAGGVMSTTASATMDKIGKMNAAAAASIAAAGLRQDNAAGIINYATKQVLAPNTRTAFNNASVRSFQFQFKMVSRSQKDTDAVRSIVQTFQKYMYPEGDDVIMKYPPTWNIKFHDGTGSLNPYIPGIYDCYLTSFTSTFNASTNIFHEDGSPIETDVTIAFQETKALTRQEIVALSQQKILK
jgi:hypothetical protein